MSEIKSLSQQWKDKKKELNDFFTPSNLVLKLKAEIESKLIVSEIADYTGGGGALLNPFSCKKIYNELLPEYFNLTPKYDIKTNPDFLSDYNFEKSQVVFLNPPFEKKQNLGAKMCIKGYDLAKEFYCLIYTPSITYVQNQKEYRDYLLKEKHLYKIEMIPAKTFEETTIPVIVFYFDKRNKFQNVEWVINDYSEVRDVDSEDFWQNLSVPIEKEKEEPIEDINDKILNAYKESIISWISLYELRIKFFQDLSEYEYLFLEELKKIRL